MFKNLLDHAGFPVSACALASLVGLAGMKNSLYNELFPMNAKSKLFKLLTLSAAMAVVAGCSSLTPQALQGQQVMAYAKADKVKVQAEVEPLSGPLSLEEAIARAIKYNADRRIRAMEEAVALGSQDLAKFDMLPKVVANAGYRNRNNDLLTKSMNLDTGDVIAAKTLSSEREVSSGDLSFTWSLLDFGQSYYAAKQSADRAFIAGERNRKAVHNLIQDVRTAYWRVVAADQLGDTLRQTILAAERALASSQAVEAAQLRSPLEPLRFQRQLLENLRMLELVEGELSTARVELATLAGLPVEQRYEVVAPSAKVGTEWLSVPVDQMELQALLNNPDVRESIYSTRIAQEETKRVMLRMFPGISFNYGAKASDDKYLVNQHWREAGAQVSFNLLGLLSAPTQNRLAELGVSMADQRRVATQMAILSQVHIARLNYANAAKQFERSDAIARVDGRMAEHMARMAQAETQSQQERVAQQTANILSQLRRYQALSNAQAAASKLQATLGLEPAVQGSDALPLADLKQKVADSLSAWDAVQLPELPADARW